MNEAERHEIELLLPWHATGRLSNEERHRVEAALEADAGLRHQAKVIAMDLAETVAGHEAVKLPRTLEADRLLARLAEEPKPLPAMAAGWLARLKDAFKGPSRAPLRWATVAAALLIALQGGAIATLLLQQERGGYQAAGGQTGALAPGTYVLVRLNDSASVAEMAAVLRPRSISIVDGPKADGFYTLRIGPAEMPLAERDARISELRSLSNLVVFVAPLK
jgi:anti-sigma factor RsiW